MSNLYDLVIFSPKTKKYFLHGMKPMDLPDIKNARIEYTIYLYFFFFSINMLTILPMLLFLHVLVLFHFVAAAVAVAANVVDVVVDAEFRSVVSRNEQRR